MMKTELSKGLTKLCSQLQLNEQAAAHLCQALSSGKYSRQALVLSPRAAEDYQPPFPCLDTQGEEWSWLPPRVLIPLDSECKPASFLDYAEGMYYLLDLSSCWESAPLSILKSPPARTLDLCAAPGGKTMLMYGRFTPIEKHSANEVNSARRGILRQNIKQCGLERAEVFGLRPDQWASSQEQFDLILADAPCSGQSLLAKGIKNPGCLGASMVNGNAKRQKGILLSAMKCLAPNGYLLYSTCTYTPEENEKVIAYLLKRHDDLQAQEVPCLSAYQSQIAPFPCYRILPHDGIGAGGFCCILYKAVTK